MELYYCHIDQVGDLAGIPLLTPARQQQLARYTRPADRQRCLAAGLLLRYVLGPDHAQIQTGPQGKPYLPQGPCFNLSHSGDYVVLGVSQQELGVDVQRMTSWRESVVRRCYTPEEQTWLREQGTDRAFFQLWTAKESVMKATGLGFRMAPASFCVLPVEDGLHQIRDQCWYMTWLSLPGHALCVASADRGPVRLLAVSREQLLGREAPVEAKTT